MSDSAHCFKHRVMSSRPLASTRKGTYAAAMMHFVKYGGKKARSGEPNYRSTHDVYTKQAQGMAPLLARHRSLDRVIRQPLVDVYGVDANT